MTDTNREFMRNYVSLSKVLSYTLITLLISILIGVITARTIFTIDQDIIIEEYRMSILLFVVVSMIMGIVGAIWLKDMMPAVWSVLASGFFYYLYKTAQAHLEIVSNADKDTYERVWFSDSEAAQFNFIIASIIMLVYFAWYYMEIEAEKRVRWRR